MADTKPENTGQAEEAWSAPVAQADAVARAAQAARDLKPIEMVEALYQSYLLDGLMRWLQDRWPSFSFHDAEDILAESVDVLYRKVDAKTPVDGIVSFLKKVAHRKACDLHEMRRKVVFLDPKALEVRADRTVAQQPVLPYTDTTSPRAIDSLDWEERIRCGLSIARGLLPRLGQENVRSVMAFIFDAVEAGREDVSTQEIGDALGLSADTARQAKSRGFRRLKRLAQDENVLGKDFDFKAIGGQDLENAEGDE